MISFIAENWGTILVGIILLCIIFGVVRVMVRDKKKGKSLSCQGSCGCCPNGSLCHGGKADNQLK